MLRHRGNNRHDIALWHWLKSNQRKHTLFPSSIGPSRLATFIRRSLVLLWTSSIQDNMIVNCIIKHEGRCNQSTEDRFVSPTRAVSGITVVTYKTEVCSSHPISYGIFDNKSWSHPRKSWTRTNLYQLCQHFYIWDIQNHWKLALLPKQIRRWKVMQMMQYLIFPICYRFGTI